MPEQIAVAEYRLRETDRSVERDGRSGELNDLDTVAGLPALGARWRDRLIPPRPPRGLTDLLGRLEMPLVVPPSRALDRPPTATETPGGVRVKAKRDLGGMGSARGKHRDGAHRHSGGCRSLPGSAEGSVRYPLQGQNESRVL
jgi:hypothetical protein